MPNGNVQVTFSDLFRSIVHEFSDALTLVRRSHPAVSVRSIRVNLGQLPSDTAEEPASQPLLLADRYPEIDKGWRLQLELGERPALKVSGVALSLAEVREPTVLDYFIESPLTVIKGIDQHWRQKFATFEVLNVGHLARLEDSILQEVIDSTHSLLPREFRYKVRLLTAALPALPAASLYEMTLTGLLRTPIPQLHESLGPQKISQTEVRGFVEWLDMLNMVIDSQHLQRIRLGQMLACRG